MVRLSMSADEFGRLVCSVGDGKTEGSATASDLDAAAASFASGLDALEAESTGECFWLEAVGEYRWVFRRVDEKVRIAVLWSTGTMTGWEHVYWGEANYAEFVAAARQEIAKVSAAASA